MIDYSYCGGKDGMMVTWDVIQQVLQREVSIVYLFAVQENPIKEIAKKFQEQGYAFAILSKQMSFNEA